jgi:spore coat protein H
VKRTSYFFALLVAACHGAPDDRTFRPVAFDDGSTPAPQEVVTSQNPNQQPIVPNKPPHLPPAMLERCQPTAGDARWLLEGDTLDLTVRCATGFAPAGFTVSPQPTGLTLDASGHVRWTPGLDQAANYKLTFTETSTGDAVTLPVGVVDRFDAASDAPIADAAKYTHEYGVPVIHITFSGDLDKEDYRPVELTYLGHRYQGATAKYRGTTSMDYPKRNYTIAFADADELVDPLLGKRDKLALITPFDDNSYMRPHMAFEVWNRMAPQHIQVKSFPVVLFINGRYWGLYTASDHIDSDLIKRAGLNKDGNLYMAYHADGNFGLTTVSGELKWSPHQGFEKKHGLPEQGQPGAFADLDALVNWINSASDADFHANLAAKINKTEYEDWWILVTLILATDNGGKNAFHYHDPAGGPFRYIPWDFNSSFGQDWDTTRIDVDGRLTFFAYNKLFERIFADPAFLSETRARYKTYLGDSISQAKVLAEFDSYRAKIDASARRDESKWKSAYRSYAGWNTRTDFTTWEQEVTYMRAWISERWTDFKANPQ